ncbi:hypothetical protein U8P73_35910 (plasmid) [Rhizobium beringeri]|uniref:hypothetical protein n=1 Tax=Rhizobium beringeri TaxID=3019934 RepID=UPI002DDCC72C|nr:hypothetical protein [Rhizobium beringeri]WSG93537.1 hypothetical protein U8P73_35910 [Rhizobium beringeri]
MEAIIAYLRKIVGLELTIDRVVSRQAKVVRDLDKLESLHTVKASKAEAKAVRAAERAEAARLEAADAAELSNNWKNSGLIRPTRKAA